MLVNDIHAAELGSPVQTIKARVELYKGSTLVKICNCGETLNEFSIERTGENKFFGYGICQKLRAILMDESEELNITDENTIEASFGVNSDFTYPFPKFYVVEVERDRETNDVTVVGYDILYKAANHTVSELGLPATYTIRGVALACASLLGVPLNIENITDSSFDTLFDGNGNFDGTESVRYALDAVAEATQTIYYINNDWELTFKRLDKDGEPVFTINRNNYFELYSNGVITLGGICHATELGDNVAPEAAGEGVTQYIRDNPFWELRDDVYNLVDSAQTAVGGMTIEQFECNWFGNYLLEIGDKIGFIAKNNQTIVSYFLNDTLTYDGAIEQSTAWAYDENEAETASNPSTLGETLKQTRARVDKVNQEISLVVEKTEANEKSISDILITTENIELSVATEREAREAAVGDIEEELDALSKEVSLKLSDENVQINVSKVLEETGVDRVKTSTGFTFDEVGLHIQEDNAEMETTITIDGMKITKNNNEVLKVNNQGVNAQNLEATTYLIINGNSRFENWGGRTAVFWIGG